MRFMAVRDTLSRVTPKRLEPKPKPKPKPKPQPKSKSSKSKSTSQPKSKSTPRPAKDDTPKTLTAKRRTPRTLTLRRRTAKAAPVSVRKPRRPVLQRRSFLSLAARSLVLALAILGMLAFAVALAEVTLVPSPASVRLVHTNLTPGASIRAYLDQPSIREAAKQIGGNVLLGAPFGVLLPMLFPRTRGLVRIVVLTAVVMLMIETTQGAIVVGRAFDIDDVILNTTGSLLGYLLLGRSLGRALHPRREHWWHRMGYGRKPEV
jgi:glycopeptide antibiotics resistance protein